jgi:30S ribosomal protein S31
MSCALDYIAATPITDNSTTPMGKGDKRTKKGKINRGSYGKRRPRKLKAKGKAATPKRS